MGTAAPGLRPPLRLLGDKEARRTGAVTLEVGGLTEAPGTTHKLLRRTWRADKTLAPRFLEEQSAVSSTSGRGSPIWVPE